MKYPGTPSRIIGRIPRLKLWRVIRLEVDDPSGVNARSIIRIILVRRIKGGWHGWMLATQVEITEKNGEMYLNLLSDSKL